MFANDDGSSRSLPAITVPLTYGSLSLAELPGLATIFPPLPLAQDAAGAAAPQGEAVTGQADGAAPQQARPQGSILDILPMVVMLGLFFYLFVLRPGNRERAEREALLGGLKKNDKIITTGGLVGIVSAIPSDGDEIIIKSDGTRLCVRRDAIREVVPKSSKGAKDGKEADAAS